jgi:hypothetical protein
MIPEKNETKLPVTCRKCSRLFLARMWVFTCEACDPPHDGGKAVSAVQTARRAQKRREKRHSTFIDLTGQVFDQLTILREDGTDSNKAPLWLCQCTCGEQVHRPAAKLRLGVKNGVKVRCGRSCKASAKRRRAA